MDASPLPPQITINGVRFNETTGQRPLRVDGCITISELFQHRCAELGERNAHREKDLGIWKSYSWADYWQHAKWIGLALRKLGLERGEVVSILSEDRKEWAWFDMGIQGVGGIASGVYTTDSASQLQYLINDSGSKFLIVEDEEHLDKFLEIESEVPDLIKVIILEDEGLHDLKHPRCMMINDLYALGQEVEAADPRRFEAEIALAKPQDTALLVYTSGTTGQPKGAMLSHENILAAIESGARALPVLASDEQLCFLPLCHILERDVSVYFPLAARCTVNFAESPETVFANLQEVSPSTFTAVPRVWEKIYAHVQILTQEATPLGRAAFGMALKAGVRRAEYRAAGKRVPIGIAVQFWIWDQLVLKNLRRMLGMDKLRRGGTGAAPISTDLLKWYWAIGVPLVEGFGMTETAGLATLNTVESNRIGTIGQVVEGCDIRISEDGEIQLKGMNIFQGYWRNNAKTAETFTADGWLRTGDMGHIDKDGFVTITGRLKDIIITAGGKNITPAEIESQLKFSHYVSDAILIGDRRKYLTALIMIDQENVEKYAQDRKIPFSNFASLCAAPEIRDLIGAEVAAVNTQFARVEQIKDFRLIDVLLTAEDDELTATMKLKRGLVEKKHGHLIEDMYS
ncbi:MULTISPECIES: long-chain fatty acid--CoA ligase [unclassified Ruegeria]|uniref:AMP-dependent synthetase/ligase n=1 Tax=unclassified Ruegeria TaxID=2625375 RepID=UPI0014885556|nr:MULTISPECIES: long-chain fatty acid--CoA ligase [unclassified Ruegeria]NOD75451.1 AMP-binding protein [Ruegeria sp. HKCCD4332]NOD87433.1 AMP-binding protein [Ruegeria sp. HKCCD4318]NOE12988.1 AMP-binding protein [Ruegeria sp. HKCCD4318-2]NOG08845.1 long-chain fatty acid--CoA ligase [Ruegeria sp. HKCCD4315]